jgi:hypothetical protein
MKAAGKKDRESISKLPLMFQRPSVVGGYNDGTAPDCSGLAADALVAK